MGDIGEVGMAMKYGRIELNPRVLGGAPVIAGTRTSVGCILAAVADMASVEKVIKVYSHLSEEAVRDAVRLGSLLAYERMEALPDGWEEFLL